MSKCCCPNNKLASAGTAPLASLIAKSYVKLKVILILVFNLSSANADSEDGDNKLALALCNIAFLCHLPNTSIWTCFYFGCNVMYGLSQSHVHLTTELTFCNSIAPFAYFSHSSRNSATDISYVLHLYSLALARLVNRAYPTWHIRYMIAVIER